MTALWKIWMDWAFALSQLMKWNLSPWAAWNGRIFVAHSSLDNYNDASRVIDGNYDDPRLTHYDTLLQNIHDLKTGKAVKVPIYDFKLSGRTGYRDVDVPSSRIVVIEGIYALSERLRPLLDLRVSVTGGVHFDLVKRVLRDINRSGQAPEDIIHQISETVGGFILIFDSDEK